MPDNGRRLNVRKLTRIETPGLAGGFSQRDGSAQATPGEEGSSTLVELKRRGGRQPACQARDQVTAGNGLVPRSVRAEVTRLLTELVTNAVRDGGANNGLPVDRTASRWGIERGYDSRTVWFELSPN